MRLKYNTVEPVLSGHPSVWLQLMLSLFKSTRKIADLQIPQIFIQI